VSAQPDAQRAAQPAAQPIYLDHAATTPLRPQVRDAMAPYLDERFGNPSSMHRWGRQARNAMEEARERLAASIGAQRRELIFTGGGTEADNLAVLGRWRFACHADAGSATTGAAGAERGAPAAGAVVYSAVEHKAVAAAAQCAGAEGASLIVLGVDESGILDLGALDQALAARPCIVSVMWANNEVGAVQPVAAVGARCRDAGVVFHTDAVQAFGKLPLHVDVAQCDLLSLSAHKIGGPKGIGALYVRGATEILPLVHGGGQERDLRPGTENVAAAIGFAAAADLAVAERDAEATRVAALRDRLEATLRQRVPGLIVNGPAAAELRLPNILSIAVPGAAQEDLLIGLDLEGVAASGGAACHTGSGAVVASHVLFAMGRAHAGEAHARLSLGWTTTPAEIDAAADAFVRVATRLRTEIDL
jgi:cysteine desulfurase